PNPDSTSAILARRKTFRSPLRSRIFAFTSSRVLTWPIMALRVPQAAAEIKLWKTASAYDIYLFIVPPLIQVKDLRTSFFTPEGEVKAVDGVSCEMAGGRTRRLVGESRRGESGTAATSMRLVPPPGRIGSRRS